MNKRIDFSFNGGFPATQYMTSYMQDSYRGALAALASYAGDKVILTGCEVIGGTITNGWISYNGELMPFIGGPWSADAQVVVVESSEARLFQDNTSHNVYFKKEARIGTPGLFAFAELRQPGVVPKGLISMWSGAISEIPKGWALCDGHNGTPDLRSRFIVGYDDRDADYNEIGKTGGEKKHQLSIAEMPTHSHDVDDYQSQDDSRSYQKGKWFYGDPGTGVLQGTAKTKDSGGSQPHENRPPFYTLALIIKL